MNLDDLVSQAEDAIHSGVSQVETIGVPALEASAENWGANVLKQNADQTQASVNRAVASAPQAAPGSFMSYLSSSLSTGAATRYAIPILIGALVVGYLVLKE